MNTSHLSPKQIHCYNIHNNDSGGRDAYVLRTIRLFFSSSTCIALCLSFYLSEHEFTCRNTRVAKHMCNMCLPHGKHTFTLYLPHVKHAVYACTCYLLLLFKPVVSHCIFLSFSLRIYITSYLNQLDTQTIPSNRHSELSLNLEPEHLNTCIT
jgi:hypothetical protein